MFKPQMVQVERPVYRMLWATTVILIVTMVVETVTRFMR